MRFVNKKEEFARTVEALALVVSLGAVFFQIWVLISQLEAYFRGNHANLLPSVILSGLALLACAGSIWLIDLHFLKGIRDGRTKTYQEKE